MLFTLRAATFAFVLVAAGYLADGTSSARAETGDFEPFDGHSLDKHRNVGLSCVDGIVGQTGHESRYVMAVQTLLDGDGFNLGSTGVDGIVGPMTDAALKDWQQSHLFSRTGCFVPVNADHAQDHITPEPPEDLGTTYTYDATCGNPDCLRKYRVSQHDGNVLRLYEKVKVGSVFKNAVNCAKNYGNCKTLFEE